MKTLGTVIALCLSLVSIAQPPKHERNEHRREDIKHFTAEQKSTLMTKKLTLDLDLNETQQDQIYALVMEKNQKLESRRANKPKERPSKDELYQMKLEQMDEKIAMRDAMRAILDDKQFNTWLNMQKKTDYVKKHRRQEKKQ